MSYDDCCCRIEKCSNGYEVEIKDPAIVKANTKRDSSKGYTPYKDPWCCYVFKTVDEVLAFLKKSLPLAVAGDEFGSSFDAAVAAPDED